MKVFLYLNRLSAIAHANVIIVLENGIIFKKENMVN